MDEEQMAAHLQPVPAPAAYGRGVRVILNLIWLVLCGFWMFLAYLVFGVTCCVLIITIPFGLAAFRIATFALWPFGRTIVRRPDAGAPSLIGNVVWFVFAGLWLALGHLATGIALCLTIIGIPLGLADFKLILVSLTPLGRVIVSTEQAAAMRLAGGATF
jgi:uncharacterized membrane protein YccF (DUF307 family)